MVIFSTIAAVIMALGVMMIRMRASKKPASARKIILPPIFMSTGALMFLHPMFRVTPLEFLEAITLGFFFSIFLIKTSNFEVKEDKIYLKRSKAFAFILIGLLLIRIALKFYLSNSIDVGELSGMFWILAFGMIVPWRIAMYLSFRKLENQLPPSNIQAT
ncbi:MULTISPECIES: CcdC family protein [Metabacillus]|uniref:Membrane protein n=1 Tax=Metabacillus indicus TaxID=246786 RepID=A0A084H442_METID|nr:MULTISPECIES: CcdC protein domain-containing protein [Metabacillus]KEZ50195.1 membrane protein [Metabacillus indicus LMG 22858]KEZ54354.1 membrane protein [Metabacillus indicus]MDX8288473.1 CcdC protein domain-containing protein [Metabacillus indicus]